MAAVWQATPNDMTPALGGLALPGTNLFDRGRLDDDGRRGVRACSGGTGGYGRTGSMWVGHAGAHERGPGWRWCWMGNDDG